MVTGTRTFPSQVICSGDFDRRGSDLGGCRWHMGSSQDRGLPLFLRRSQSAWWSPAWGGGCLALSSRNCLASSKVVVSLSYLFRCHKKKSAYKQLECVSNLIKIIKVIACEKSSKTNYYRAALWEDENCWHSLGLWSSTQHRKCKQCNRSSLRVGLPCPTSASHLDF